MIKTLNDLHYNFSGYQKLISLYENCDSLAFDEIDIEMNTWFDANLSAALGGILDKIGALGNSIKLDHIQDNTRLILQKNGFLAHFGFPSLADTNDTTIKYLKMKPSDSRYFNTYVMTELLSRSELPRLPIALKKKIAESIYEIFVNAQMHSETEFIYTCGQFFPKRNQISFTICDTGIGIRESVRRRFDRDISAAKAIKWATTSGNTTKREISGGIGLAILKEFIVQNKGCMQIVSNEGFFELNSSREELKSFTGEFPGTVVTMVFNTNDFTRYGIMDESLSEDLF